MPTHDAMTQSVALPCYTIGPGAYGEVGSVLGPQGGRILLIGGERGLAAGLLRLEEALSGRPARIAHVHRFAGECTVAKAQELKRAAWDMDIQVIAGMGGGKALDTAKACAHYAGLPVVTMPTIAATCAAVTKLSVMYREDGAFDRFLFLDAPPRHAFLHTGILAEAPDKYLRAGMGDALAKHFESTFSARGKALSYGDSLGIAISRTCYEPLLKAGAKALRDCRSGLDSPELREAVLCNIVSTGLVSILVRDCYNGALAHSLYYAMETIPEIRQCLHGDVVAWGALVQLVMDGQAEKAEQVLALLKRLGTPASLKQMGLGFPFAGLGQVLEEVLLQPDMACLPYPVTAAMVRDAMEKAEAMTKNCREGE